MATEVIVRGNTITFLTHFFDKNGAPTNPANAKLYVDYPLSNGRAQLNAGAGVAMSLSGFDWTADWESNASDAGRVEWSVVSGSASPFIREDGFFILSANPANPEP